MEILLAEDEKRMNRALCEILRQEGYDVDSFEDGENALRVRNGNLEISILPYVNDDKRL